MFFQRIVTAGLSINSYLLGDETTQKCIVIDPTRHIVPYIIQAQNAGLDITDILETHVHADFVSGSKELKHQLNEKPRIHVSEMGGEKWVPSYADERVHQGTQLRMGDLRLEALHTPGHTAEHLSWVCYDESRSATVPWFAFTGDCLFVGSVGRPDLMGIDETSPLARKLYQTLFERLAVLPDFLEVFPTHGKGSLCGKSLQEMPSSTMGYERLFNPYFQKKDLKQWIVDLLKGQSAIPPYFQRVKNLNVAGPPLLNSLKMAKWDQGERRAPTFEELFLLDIRHPEAFAVSHIPGSLNIPFFPVFAPWAGWLLPAGKPIGLIVENLHLVSEIKEQLRLMGFDQDIWLLPLEGNGLIASLFSSSFAMIDVEELARHRPKFEWFYLLDVRTREEWQTGHILGAHHMELTRLDHFLGQLPHDQSIALLCRTGHRASIGASLLKQHGFNSVANLRGGMAAWIESGFPVTVEKTENHY